MNNDLAFTKPCRKDLCHFLFDKSKFVVLLLISLLLLFQHCHRLTLRPGVHLFAFADSCHIKSKPDLGKTLSWKTRFQEVTGNDDESGTAVGEYC